MWHQSIQWRVPWTYWRHLLRDDTPKRREQCLEFRIKTAGALIRSSRWIIVQNAMLLQGTPFVATKEVSLTRWHVHAIVLKGRVLLHPHLLRSTLPILDDLRKHVGSLTSRGGFCWVVLPHHPLLKRVRCRHPSFLESDSNEVGTLVMTTVYWYEWRGNSQLAQDRILWDIGIQRECQNSQRWVICILLLQPELRSHHQTQDQWKRHHLSLIHISEPTRPY